MKFFNWFWGLTLHGQVLGSVMGGGLYIARTDFHGWSKLFIFFVCRYVPINLSPHLCTPLVHTSWKCHPCHAAKAAGAEKFSQPYMLVVFPYQPLRTEGCLPDFSLFVSKVTGVKKKKSLVFGWDALQREKYALRNIVIHHPDLALTWPWEGACAKETWRYPRVTLASLSC